MNSNLLRRYIRVLLENAEGNQAASTQQSSEETLKNTDIFTLLGKAQDDPSAFLELFDTGQFDKYKDVQFEPATVAKIIACLRKGLPILGAGSSRVVFKYDENSVIKVTRNAAGVKQNQLEHTASKDPMVGPIIARVLENDIDFQWIISEKVKPISSEAEFTLLSGIEHKNFKEEILALDTLDLKENHDQKTGAGSSDYSSLLPDFESTIKQGEGCLSGKEFLNDVKAFLTRYKINAKSGVAKTDLFVGDIYKYDSWGVSVSGCLVLFDFGTTNSTYDKLFASGSFSDKKARRANREATWAAANYDRVRDTRLPTPGVIRKN